jgi:hypothetical protein
MRAFIIILLIALCWHTAFAAPEWNTAEFGNSGDAQSEGKSAADTIKGYQNGGAMQNMLQGPVMGTGEMTTLGMSYRCGDKGDIYDNPDTCNADCASGCSPVTFDATLQCESSEKAIVIEPVSFAGGGEVSLRVQYDANLDGIFDKTVVTPNISGFCVNGVMSCTPGTLNQCKFYEFAVPHRCSSAGEDYNSLVDCLNVCSAGSCTAQTDYVDIVKSTQEKVGRCDCTNSACGKSFNSSFDSAMALFGGGIASQMITSLGIAVGKASVDPSTLSVSYMAMVAGKCGIESADIAKIKAGKSTGTPDYTAALLDAVNDPDSVYNIITSGRTVKEGQCESVNSVVLSGNRLAVSKSGDSCMITPDCKITDEYACEPVCPPNSIYMPSLNKCELYNYPAGYFYCPDGFQFGRFNAEARGFEALPTVDGAQVCYKQLSKTGWDIVRNVYFCRANTSIGSFASCIHTISVSNRLALSIPSGSVDSETWSFMTLHSYAYNGARYTNLNLYPDNAHITDWETHEHEKTATTVNGVIVPAEVYDDGGNTGHTLIYRTASYSIPTSADADIQFHLNMTDWPGYDNINVTTYLAVTVNIRQKNCPEGWFLENGKCYQYSKALSSLSCSKVKADITEQNYCSYAANSTGMVCGDGKSFHLYGEETSSTTAGSGRFVTKKKYVCTSSNQEYNYSDIEAARKNIQLYENGDDYILSYMDESGAVRTIDLDGQYGESGCQKSCRVLPLENQSSVQVTHEQTPIKSSDSFASRLCVENQCPYDSATEKILQDCQCTQNNDFGKVISIFGVLEESTKDKICVQ